MSRTGTLIWMLLLGVGASGIAAAQQQPAASAAPPATLVCHDQHQCKGPKVHGKQFALLTAPHARVAARGERWGDYYRVQLILSNASADSIDFDPRSVVALTATGVEMHAAVVTELDEPRQGPGIMLGSGNPTAGYYPTVLGGVNPRSVIRVDPAGDAANTFDSLMHQHEPELRQMLTKQLAVASLAPGETIAGYILMQPPANGVPARVRVAFAGNVFDLPLPEK